MGKSQYLPSTRWCNAGGGGGMRAVKNAQERPAPLLKGEVPVCGCGNRVLFTETVDGDLECLCGRVFYRS